MIGKLLSGAVKLVTLPVAIIESVGDVITGGDGSARSKRQSDMMLGQTLIDGVCKAVESIDE